MSDIISQSMKPSELAVALRLCVEADQPAFIWGGPGVGKSSIVRQVADGLYGDPEAPANGASGPAYFRDVRVLLLDPVDLRGLPSIADGKTTWNQPDFLPATGEGIILLDELNAAPPMMMAACYQLVLDRRLGEYTVPPGWRIIAAGNREGERAVAARLPSPLANRLEHFDLEPDLTDWTRWALANGVRPEVVAFLRFREGSLYDFNRDTRENATPRSWEAVSRMLAAGPPAELEHRLYAGSVGMGHASEFCAFLRIHRQLPSIDAILLNPGKVPIPSEPSALYALSLGLARRASEQNIEAILAYVSRYERAEFGVVAVREMLERRPDLAETRAAIAWFADHQQVLM